MNNPKKLRGMAYLKEFFPERQRMFARQGGRAAHVSGAAHVFTPGEASAAGRKGAAALKESGKAHRFTAEECARGGRKSRRRGKK